jgi:SAM-dependent methyltransferase
VPDGRSSYDDEAFCERYLGLRRSVGPLSDRLEHIALEAALPAVEGACVLDLGCGAGALASDLVRRGANHVVGVDASERLLDIAACRDDTVGWIRADMADLAFRPGSFHLVVSVLALHYVADYEGACRRVRSWLRPGGVFVLVVEHPIATAGRREGDGELGGWVIDAYADEGPRTVTWLGAPVSKYHRRLSTYVAGLTGAGFAVDVVDEPVPSPELLASWPDLDLDLRRPPFLLLRGVVA